MSIRQLQQLGKAREQTQPAKQKKPVDFDDFDLGDWDKDADDFSDGEDQKYGLKAERNYGGKANQPKFDIDDEDERGFGGFGDEDDEDNDSFGLDDQEVDPSDLDDDFGAQKYGDPTKKRNPSAPKKVSRPEFSDDDDDFGAKDAGNIKLDDDTPPPEVLKPPARGKGPQLSESEDAIDFDLGAAVKEAKVEAERIKMREKENQDAEKSRLDQLMKAKDDSRRKGRDFSKEDALGDLADRIDKSLQLPKEPQNTSGIKAKDDSAGGMSDYLKGFLGEMSVTSPLTEPIGKVISGNEFGGMLDNSIDDAIGAENPNIDDKKSFEEFDVEKKFADLEDSDPIPAGRPLAKDGGARSNSNADQLDLLKDLNSRVNGSKDVSSNPFDRAEQHSDPEQAIMLDDNEANQNIDDEDESADKNLDNFLAEQEQPKEGPQRNNFLVDLSKDLPTKKPNSKEQKNPTKPPIKTTATKSIGFDSSLNSISKGSNRGGVIGGVTGGGTQTKRTGGGSESKLPVPSSRTFHGHPKMSHVGKAKIVREDSEVDKIVGLLRAELDQKEVEIVKLETQLESALNQRTDVERTCSDLRKDKVKLEVERNDVINRLDLVMKQIANLELDKKVLQSDNTQKGRLLKERQEMTERGFVNSALENQKRIYEAEIESRNLKIDMLQNQIAALTDKVKLIQTAKISESKGFSNQEDVAVGRQAGTTSLRQNNNMFPLVDGTVTDLKQQILELQRKLDKRNGFLDRQGRPEVHQDSLGGSNNAMDTRGDLGHKIPSSHNEEVLSMLVKGLARENERVIKECNKLKKEGTKQRTQTDTMGSKDLVGKDFEHLETIKRLQDELLKKDEYFKNQLANFQDKAMRTDKVEAECAEFKRQLAEATNTKDVLEDKVKMLEDKLQRREQALNEAREERDVSETKLREAVRNQDE